MKCFDLHDKENVPCQNKTCRMWINCKEGQNCTLILSKKGPLSLQEIGDILGVTRMRICQIEKKVVQKLSGLVLK
jgi:hypothetical protein